MFQMLLLILTLIPFLKNQAFNPDPPVKAHQRVILDTDLSTDVDDVGALAILLNLHKIGAVDLLGIIVTSNDPYSAVCASSIDCYYGLPQIPVGFIRSQRPLFNNSRYTKCIASEFPSKLHSWSEAKESTSLYRRLLATSPDESVIIITIGPLSSLQKLLQSSSDQNSTLNGTALFNKKVKEWICMGGEFPNGKESNFYRHDPQSTVYCMKQWEKKVIFCGWELGTKVITGGIGLKYKLNPKHPIYRAYELYNHFEGRPSWDQIAILQLTDRAANFFSYSVNGRCQVTSDVCNKWLNVICGNHRYVNIRPGTDSKEVASYIESLIF